MKIQIVAGHQTGFIADKQLSASPAPLAFSTLLCMDRAPLMDRELLEGKAVQRLRPLPFIHSTNIY